MLNKSNPLDWREIIENNPDAREGRHNIDRKKLLQVGVYLDLSRFTAESWIPELRVRRRTAEQVARTQDLPVPETDDDAVRVTIVEIPDATKKDAIGGEILVEAAGMQARMNASVFYNYLHGEDHTPIGFNSDVPLIGLGENK